MAVAVSAHEKYRPLTSDQFYVHERLTLGDQIVELQELKDRSPHLSVLPNQNYNLNEIQVILEQNCYDAHHAFEFKKSEEKVASWAVKPKIGRAVSVPPPVKQAATLATTAHQLQMIKRQTSSTPQFVMSPDTRNKNNEQSKRDSTVKDPKLNFCGEKTK